MKREQGRCRLEANRLAALYRQEVKLYPIAIINTTVKALGMSVMDAFVGSPHNIGAGALGNAADRQTDLGAASCNHSTAAVALCQTALYLIPPIEARQANAQCLLLRMRYLLCRIISRQVFGRPASSPARHVKPTASEASRLSDMVKFCGGR